jgi:membrane-associated protease RseP (regulator of RpoE activity)
VNTVTVRIRAISALALGVLATGCVAPTTLRQNVDPALAAREAATQKRMAVERQFKDQLHVARVARPILVGAAELCGEHTTPTVGFYAGSALDFGKDFQQAARDAGLSDTVTIVGVVKASPAGRAGLQAGDTLVAIDGWRVPAGANATKTSMDQLKAALADGRLALSVARDGTNLELAINAENSCDYPVLVQQSDAINAFADGKSIHVTQGMLRFVENDQELSLVIGHELAHNAMGHIGAQRTNYVIGSVFDILAAAAGVNTQGTFGNAGASAFSQGFESEADYVGLYALARAGVPLDGAANFWRRMGVATGAIKTQYSSSHPGTAERFVAIENAVAEIHEKQVNGEALAPNRKTAPRPTDKK